MDAREDEADVGPRAIGGGDAARARRGEHRGSRPQEAHVVRGRGGRRDDAGDHDTPHAPDDDDDLDDGGPRAVPARGPLERAWLNLSAELAPRAVARSRDSVERRVTRARQRIFFIVQCALSASLAWYIAGVLLGHPEPFFAPIAALVALGQSYGQRIERVVQIVMGVAIGVLVGDTFVHYFGAGFWQLAVIIVLSMTVTSLLGAGMLMVTQAGVQSAFVTMIVAGPGEAFSRWTDALVGGLVALAAATITPVSPLRRPRRYTGTIVVQLGEVLSDTARALRERDRELAAASLTKARETESALERLHDLADDGLAVIRSSPFRRGHLPAVQAIADIIEPLDRAIRNIRVLVRRATIALREGEQVPKAYIDLIDDLAAVARTMADDLAERNLPTGAQPHLLDLAERTTYVSSRPSLSSEVIRAQVRSTIVDLLMVTGLTHSESLDYIPTSYSLEPEGDAPATEPLFLPAESEPEPQTTPLSMIDPVTGPLDREAIARSLAQREHREAERDAHPTG